MHSFQNSDSASTLVVGDIHGCFDELITLIELAGLGEHDNIVGVGDLIDRGPKNREVVDFFTADTKHRRSVRGNHEHKHLQNRGRAIPSKAGHIVRLQTTEIQYDSMLAYFETMPLWIEMPDALVVHAGLEPGIPLDKQVPKTLLGVGSSGRSGFDGKSPWWFESQDLVQTKPIVFGHEKHEEGVVRGSRNNVFGIDTGAALGGPLTGLLLPEFRLISVPAPDYWSQQLKEWLPKLRVESISSMSWDELLTIDLTDSTWPQEAHSEILAANEAYHWLAQVIEQRREELIVESGYLKLEGPQRGDLQRRWRNTLSTDLDHWVIESLPARDVHSLVRQKLPDWESLRKRLESMHAASKLPLPA